MICSTPPYIMKCIVQVCKPSDIACFCRKQRGFNKTLIMKIRQIVYTVLCTQYNYTNVPVAYIAQDVKILMRARAIGRGGP
jgi:hypothetical protein